MSRVGLDWYKREPVAYLGDVQGLTSKEHAVYSVVIDLLYVHGGTIRNDPKWIAGWISDMGSSSVRKSLASLDANPRITIEITDDEISQNRAKTEAKTKQNLRETAQKHGKIGGQKSAELRRQSNEINGVDAPDPSTEIQAEKTREDKISKRDTKVSTKKRAEQFPEDWTPNEKAIQSCRKKGYVDSQIGPMVEDCINHHRGKGNTFKDFNAAFRMWASNQIKFHGEPHIQLSKQMNGGHNGNGTDHLTSNRQAANTERLRRIITAAAEGTSTQDWATD